MTRSHAHSPANNDLPTASITTASSHAPSGVVALPAADSPPLHRTVTRSLQHPASAPCAPAVSIQRARRFNDRPQPGPVQELPQYAREVRALQETVGRLEETQRIAGLGYWSFYAAHGLGHWSDECFRITGISPATDPLRYRQLSRLVHPDDRPHLKDRIDAALHDGRTFEIEIRLFSLDGELRWIRLIGQPMRDEIGQICRLHGTVMEVTHRKLIEQRQSMEHGVAHLLAGCGSLLQAIPGVIQTICGGLGWNGGALWLLDAHDQGQGQGPGQGLRRTAWWASPGSRAEALFQQGPGAVSQAAWRQGLLARALCAGEPIWVADLGADPDLGSGPDSPAPRLRAALAFPVEAAGKTFGVMSFFAPYSQRADPEMLTSASVMGRHIGQFFQREQAEAALRQSEAHFRAVVEQASDGFYVHDVKGRLIDVNQRGCDALGYDRSELLDMSLADIDPELSVERLESLLESAGPAKAVALESRHRRRDGSTFPVELRIGAIEINGQQHLLSLARDVSERQVLQDHIQHLAYHDALTSLPNRAMFNRKLSQALTRARPLGRRLAVMFIDLDRFKNINDTLGHNAGDHLLQEMARRLQSVMRQGELLARLGGDEFVVLLEDIGDTGHIALVARRVLDALVRQYPLDGQIVHITASIGISVCPDDSLDQFSLMKHADVAMYRAKDAGKNNFQFYSAHDDAYSAEQLALESSLRRGIERNELVLHYQPKVSADTGRISGVEVLVRWQHPQLGLLQPQDFIGLAEETGLVVPLTKWVLHEACMEHGRWLQSGLPPLNIAVNLSARHFVDDHLLDDIKAILVDTGMAPKQLELEITESMMMRDTARSLAVLDGLKALGIRIAIDDFGIGYSSLSQLKEFPIDILKIDRSFIVDIPGDEADEAIAGAIIAMARSLKMQVVAEGVEVADQVAFLRRRGCDELQGFYYSPPLPAADIRELLQQNMRDAGEVHALAT
jgi:diguanylate cyclase (GGDEF)-like protein/PAS domain S-box-containing protein